MPYNELRKDYLLDRWVVIATERARRPTDLAKRRPEQTINIATCPLCPGNEHVTPPAVLVYTEKDGQIVKTHEEGKFRSKGWTLRTIPNLFPAFNPPITPEDGMQYQKNGNFGCAVGHHEVLVESSAHTNHPADAEVPQVVHVLNAYKERLAELSAKQYVKYVQIFRNHGLEAGASLSHAHSQIIATPFVPRIPKEEHLASKTYFEEHGSCIFCDTLKQETKSPRLILENAHFVVFAPYASVHPLEFWIAPKRHNPTLQNLTQTETAVFAQTLKTTLKALKDLVNDPPYNYGLHLALQKEAQDYYHWHLEVYPSLAIWAGFEKTTGMYINTVTPEVAAESLRNVLNA
jgi:UDPglucose--hexose-1-phosphate uridylyltransferase